ncbi:MAG: DUF3857 domain-containing protein [Chitinophagales bacterium]
MKKIILTILIGMGIFLQPMLAQEKVKIGKIDEDFVTMSSYEQDPEAKALILHESQEVDFRIILEQIHQVVTTTKRVKIFDKSAFDEADISIRYHKKDRVLNLKAFTYVMENGKVEKYNIKKDQIFTEKESENYMIKKFTFPNVKEGAVIEYSYKLESRDFIGLTGWVFQDVIPTLYSKYTAYIPRNFNYVTWFQGDVPLSVNERKPYTSNGSWQYTGTEYNMVAKDVPAFKIEPFATSMMDYLTAVRFQLKYIEYLDFSIDNVMTSWDNLAKDMLTTWDSFGGALKRSKKLVSQAEAITATASTDEEKVQIIYDYVINNIKWNGKHGKLANQSLNKVFEDRTGKSSEVNLCLTAMLKGVGLEVHPALISTRRNGKVMELYPFYSQFNRTVVYVELGDKWFLLDATNPMRPMGMLPPNQLNGVAWIVKNPGPEFKDLTNAQKYRHVANAVVELAADGTISGSLTHSDTGYSALGKRSLLKKEGEKAYIANLQDSFTEATIENISLENKEEMEQALKTKCTIETTDFTQVADDFIYLSPMMNEGLEDNPLKLEKRNYPVDFTYPRSYQYILSLTIPEGYEIAELPESAKLSLPNGGGKFTYVASKNGKVVQLMSKLDIKQVVFTPEEYAAIRGFYAAIVEKHAEQIVLKKGTN